ncbi:Putative_ubiquitin fusion degradation protein [Hexamita inflata]|uniref:Ubiquitin fusion degradation protein n=1 Tax=Hexamita inflata TaxID=28002 RepID=A0AA86QVN1_9EUKA|nr:Putative ubiquitin fusion degradation protein [Hexamita inflata]
MSVINKHMGKPFTSKNEFPVNYSRQLQLQDNRKRKITLQQNEDFQNSGKIMVSTEIMHTLTNRNLIKNDAPVQFCIHNTRTNIMLMCGIDFQDSISSDQIYLPDWIHEYMDAQPNDNIFINFIELQLCASLTMKAEVPEFYDIPFYEKQLTEMLPHYSAIMQGQWIRLIIDGNDNWLQVIKCEPIYASLIDTTITLQFESPEGLDNYELKKNILTKLNAFSNAINGSNTIQDKINIINIQQEEGEQKIFIKQMFVGKGRKL